MKHLYFQLTEICDTFNVFFCWYPTESCRKKPQTLTFLEISVSLNGCYLEMCLQTCKVHYVFNHSTINRGFLLIPHPSLWFLGKILWLKWLVKPRTLFGVFWSLRLWCSFVYHIGKNVSALKLAIVLTRNSNNCLNYTQLDLILWI